MRNDTRRLYAAYEQRIAELNGVDRVDRKFSVVPTIQQKLETRVQESSEFLSRINVIGVPEMEGEKVGLGVSGPVASTTDTSKQERQTTDLAALDHRRYRCEKTDSDTHITYQRLDTWAKFPDFQTRLRDATGAKSLSFEYQYTLSLLVTDFADSADAITVPVLAWLRENQPELFTNPDKRLDGFKFETDVLNHDCVDLLVKLPLTERVIVKVADGGYEVSHAAEPVDPYDDPSGWKLPAP